MFWRRGVWIFLIVLVCNGSVFGQYRKSQPVGDPQPQYRNFSVEQGLPSSETYFVHQDKKGYIWICTDRGVARYDGYRFRVFTRKDGLTDDVVFRIYEDKKGRLWFITYNGLLCYWDGQKIRSYKYNNRIKEYLKKGIFTYKSFSIDEKDNVVYNAQYNGLIKIDSKGNMQSFPRLKTPCLLKINGDWLYDESGVSSVLHVYTSENAKPVIIPEIPARCELVELKGKRVICVQDFLYDLDRLSKHTRVFGLFGLSKDDQYIWGLTRQGVLQYSLADIEQGGKRPSAVFLPEQTVTCVLKDSEGGYWFSTLDDGVFYARNLTVKTYHHVLKNNNIRYIRVKNDQVICSNIDGYRSFGSENWTYRSETMINNLVFWNNHIYLNTGRKYFAVNPVFSLLKEEKINNRPEYSIYEFKDCFNADTAIFLCASGYICSFNRQGQPTEWFIKTKENTGKTFVFEGICIDHKNRILLGNNNGIYEFRKGHFYQNPDPLFKTRVVDLDYHPLWGCVAGTRGKGVLFFENDKVTGLLSESDGLLSNNINKILIDDKGILWIVSNHGLNRIIKQRDGSIKIASLTRLNGLPTNEINGIEKDANGNVWLATKKGLVVVTKDHKWGRENDNTRFWVEQIEFSGRIYKHVSQQITLDSGTDYIRFVLGTSSFRTGKNRAIRYKFSPGGQWIYSNQGSILITKPASGDLSLILHYKNENGVWISSGESIKITILPPVYATWYFIAGITLIGMFGMFLLFRLRLRQLKRKHSLQDTINQLEQKALRAQMNPHFIFNSLNSIQSFLIYEENEKAEKYLLKFAQLIRITLNNSRETYIPIEAEIDSLKRYLELEQMRFKDKFTFEIHNELSMEELQYGVPPMLIQPFVENAVLHGFKSIQSGGLITLRFISMANGGLNCEVEDNGVGRNATLQHKLTDHKSFGTKITEERLTAFRQKYGDDFRVEIIDKEENGEATGTKVILLIPVTTTHNLNL